jgi:tetratricopeptide (TPR) repeat protein
MDKENVITFIAIWEQDFGAKVIEIYPSEEIIDFNSIANNIFITYQNFYKKQEEIQSDQFIFTLPFENIHKKAKICIYETNAEQEDSIQQRSIVVLLLPDYFPDEKIEIFDELIQNIGLEYNETKSPVIKKYHEQVNELFILEQRVTDSEILIDDSYLIQNALEDFKIGLEQYKKKELDRSYFLLSKAHLKFELDNQLKLLLETTFFIGTILMEKNKFKVAGEYFQKLEHLAQQLEHEKYVERAIFMGGYCNYQVNDYRSAYEKFMKLADRELKYVSKFQYGLIRGKLLADVGHFDNAIKSFEEALGYSELLGETNDLKKKKAEIFSDLGHIKYDMVYQATRSGNVDSDNSKSNLYDSIKYFEEVIKIWESMDNIPRLIDLNKQIASIYEILGELDNAIQFYEKALEFAELSNDIVNRFEIIEKLIQTLAELGRHEEIFKRVDEVLHDIAPVAYFDRFTVAGLHRRLAESLIELGRDDDAMAELLVALNLYENFSKPVPELSIVYKKIIEIYKHKEDSDRIKYYKDRRKKLKIELYELSKLERVKYNILDIIEEFWIFTNEGNTLFTYTPKINANSQLLSGFLIAMNNFGSELKAEQLKTIKFGSEYFSYYKEKDRTIFIVGRSNDKYQVDLVEEIIKKIYIKFWEIYGAFIDDVDEDTTKFEPFLKMLKEKELNNI